MRSHRSGRSRQSTKKKPANRTLSPSKEAARLAELREFSVLDTPPEAEFDDLTALAAHICEAPIALITFVDEKRQWFKSETARNIAFCAHTIEYDKLLVVPDVAADERFSSNPLVTAGPQIRFYAGAPLVTSSGHALGSICVLDTVPRHLRPDQELALRVLSRHVMAKLELRKSDALRRAAEAALQESHAQLERTIQERTSELQVARAEAERAKQNISQVIERLGEGLIALDTNWRYTYVNEKASELLGKKPEELLGKHIWTEFPETVGQPFHHACLRARAEQKSITLKAYEKSWDRWFDTRIHPYEDGISVFFQEITAQKRAEEHLERERHLSEAVIASLPGLFYIIDEQEQFLRWNRRMEEVTGLTSEQLATRHPLDLVHAADHEAIQRGIAKVFAKGESTTEARIVSADGTPIWHLCTGKRITFAGRLCLVGMAVDISETKRAESLLREAQTRLELAVRSSGLGLWDWDIANDRAFVSPEWRAQFGFTEPELAHPSTVWESRLHPDDKAAAVKKLKDYLRNPGSEYTAEARVRDNNGRYRWIFTRAQLLRNEHGQPTRMLGCHIDVTQHRETEKRLRQQREQLRALAQHLNSVREEEAGRIARELHDELGAALTGLKIDVNRLGQRLEKDTLEAQRAHIQSILSSIDSTIRSVRKICLDLRPAILDQLGLSAAVEWLIAEFQRRTGIGCELHQPESISIDTASAITVFRILQELLTNVTRHAQATAVSVAMRREPDKLLLEVFDNGKGLPGDALLRHDRFGLLGVRERLAAVGGKVNFISPEGGGTRVVVCVPIE